MPISAPLKTFLQRTVVALGDFGPHYITPLRAFMSLADKPEKIQSVVQRGLTPALLIDQLQAILAQDMFLLSCCGDADRLALALDLLFFSRLQYSVYVPPQAGLGFSPSLMEQALAELENAFYGYGDGTFKKTAYFHIFNFAVSQGDEFPEPPYEEWKFQRLDQREVARIFGENTLSSFLSPPETGTVFLVVEDINGFNEESLQAWLKRRWQEVMPYRQVLQYSKDAVIDIDYVVPDFSPPWVNQIQRGGLFYMGTPRQDRPPTNLWHLHISIIDSENLNALWRGYQTHQQTIQSSGSSLRKAIRIAGNFFEDSHKKSNRTEQFMDLIISLEALYSPSDTAEATFRISQSCALLVSDESLETRDGNFQFLKSMFRKRGKLFHGQYDLSDQSPQEFVTDEEIKKLLSIVRRSILKFLALHLRGEQKLEKVRQDIQKAILDEGFRWEFLVRADFEAFLSTGQ